ncbi:MAG: EutN/CcmL family microcompartment protein [Planctomycetota bacterium]
MILARVAGTVVASQKNKHLEGNKILVVQPLDLKQQDKGDSFLAIDRVCAGEGDIVLVHKEGGAVRILYKNEEIPLQSVIVAVVDNLDIVD